MMKLIEIAVQKCSWELVGAGKLQVVKSPLLSSFDFVTHAFTTRHGGNSPPPLDSFNLGRHWPSEESRIDAMKNREILCSSLGLEFSALAVPGQQHTANIEIIAQADQGPFHYTAVDALATGRRGQPLLLHFADCVPVILVDTKKPAICVIHAGWRGTAAGIAGKAVRVMGEAFQTAPKDIAAAIGPAIGSCCYQTGPDVPEQLQRTIYPSHKFGNEDHAAANLIEHKSDGIYPDLKAFNALQLLQEGVEQIDVTAWCTSCHPEIFYSHRAQAGQTGRHGAIACLV